MISGVDCFVRVAFVHCWSDFGRASLLLYWALLFSIAKSEGSFLSGPTLTQDCAVTFSVRKRVRSFGGKFGQIEIKIQNNLGRSQLCQ